MLVLIDESGCSGFKIGKGSTPYFVVAMVIFADLKEAEHASKAISILQKDLSIRPEFKFSKTSSNVKDIFFKTIQKYNFLIRTLTIEKKNIFNHHFRQERETFYNYFVKLLIKNNQNILTNASIKIDGTVAKVFKQTLYSYLRQQLGKGKIKKFKFVDSEQDNLIQLADMVVGAIARHQNSNRKDASRWYDMLQDKIEDIVNLPD